MINHRLDAFELWCWKRLLRVPWTARESNQSILKEIHPEYSLEGLMLKLKLQYFGHLMWRTDSFEKTLMLGKIEGGRRRGRQRMRWLDGITDSMDMSVWVIVTHLCLTPYDPMDWSLSDSFVHRILQARILEWVPISFSRGSSWPRDQNTDLLHCRQILYHLSHPGKPTIKRHF